MKTVIGDPHAKNDNLDKIYKLFTQVESMGNDCIWLGDMLDTKEVVRSKCLNAYYKYFKTSKLKHYILVGNHDWHNLECKDHSLQPLKALPNVTVIDTICYVDGLFFIPYFHDIGRFKQELTAYGMMKDPKGILIMHQGVVGFDYGNGFLEKEGLQMKDLEQFKLVISGHFHTFQNKENLVYLGTPFTHAFGETHYTKYLGVLNEETLDLDLVETQFPKHITATVNANERDNASGLLEMMLNKDDYNRVVLKGTKENVTWYANLIKKEYPACKIIEIPDGNIKNLVIDEKEDNLVKFSKWAKQIKKMDTETIKLGMELLNELR